MKVFQRDERGAVNVPVLMSIVFGILALGFGIAFGWAYMQWNEAKTTVDQKIAAAVETTKAEQKVISDAVLADELKRPYSIFQGSPDFGMVSFQYPRTWSVYRQDSGEKSGNMVYYMYPYVVPAVNDATIYALRLSVINKTYETVLGSYAKPIEAGYVTARPVVIGEFEGMRIEGKLSDTIGNAAMVIFKIRDKTLIVRTDSPEFLKDFNDTILTSLKFNP